MPNGFTETASLLWVDVADTVARIQLGVDVIAGTGPAATLRTAAEVVRLPP